MKLIALFSAGLSVLLTKWAVIGVLWLGSVFLVTSSALLMDQFSDWAQRFAGYSTPYAKQKTKAKAANKKAAAANKKLVRQQKQMGRRLKGVKAHSARVRKLGGKVVARNIADASIIAGSARMKSPHSPIPNAGSVAGSHAAAPPAGVDTASVPGKYMRLKSCVTLFARP